MYTLLLLLNIFLCSAYSQLQECGGIIKAAELELKSPGYPNVLKPDICCEWVVQSVSDDICHLEVEFIFADLHDASLIIAGVLHSGSLAGIRTFFFKNNTTVYFRSGKSMKKGFDIILKQKICEDSLTPCGSVFNSKEIVINGPPSTTKECSYIIKPFTQDACQIEVKFQNFYLISSPNCVMGGIEIGEDILCGNFDGYKKYNFIDKKLKIRFYIDQISLRNQFTMKLSQVICKRNVELFDNIEDFDSTQKFNVPLLNNNPSVTNYNFGSCCNRVHSERHFFLASPGFPNSNYIDCTYNVKKNSPEIQFLKFTFKYFLVGDQDYYNNCNGGFLQIDENFFCGCQTGLTWIEPFNYYSYSEFKTLRLFINQPSQNRFIGFVIEVIQCQFTDYQPRYKRQIRVNFTDIISRKDLPDSRLNSKLFSIGTEGNKEDLNNTENNKNRKAKIQTHENIGILPDSYCLSWNIKDWILLLQQAVWAQFHCPTNVYPILSKLSVPLISNEDQITVPNKCIEEIPAHGWIQLPDYTPSISQDEYCFRFRQIPDKCILELIFHEIQISWSEDCRESYIFISRIGNLCFIPNHKRVQIDITKGPVELKIRSRERKDTRIHLEFQQLPCILTKTTSP